MMTADQKRSALLRARRIIAAMERLDDTSTVGEVLKKATLSRDDMDDLWTALDQMDTEIWHREVL